MRPGDEKKRSLLRWRFALTIATCYLVVLGEQAPTFSAVLFVVALILSNLLLAAVPAAVHARENFSVGLLLGDTAMVLVGLQGTVGLSQDFLIVYFFLMFLATGAGSLGQVALGSALVSGLYGYWSWIGSGGHLALHEWLRLPYFFLIGMFYAHVALSARRERRARNEVVREQQLHRALVSLASAYSAPAPGDSWRQSVCLFIEAVLPGTQANIELAADPRTGQGERIPIEADARRFGELVVRKARGGALVAEERELCRVAAAAAGAMLRNAEQAESARDGVRAREQFLGLVSHELRTPLHAILGYVDMLDSVLNGNGDGIARESIERVRANACRLQDLLEEILAFAELRAGKTSVRVESVNLPALLEHCQVSIREQLAGRPIELSCSIADDVPALRTDRRKLRQVLTGLLNNAAKFTEAGFVRVTARCSAPGRIEIAVSDSGIGIAPGDVKVIFQEFRQLDASLSRRFNGIGLGLSLARELAGMLGGEMTVESQPRRGATFRVDLPISLDAGGEKPRLGTASPPDVRPGTTAITAAG